MAGSHPIAGSGGGDRGFALLIVLWSMVFLSLLFSRLVSAGRSEAEIASNLRQAAQLQAKAEGVLYGIIFSLLGPSAGQWKADGGPHRIEIPGATVTASIVNLAGRINPNSAPPALLDAVLRQVGADSATAQMVSQAIVDWRSPDAQGKFEAPQYIAAGLSYTPAGSPFQSIAEIGQVLGMTPRLLAELAPHLSLYNADNPDPRFADAIVQRSLKDTGMKGAISEGPRPLRAVTLNVVIVAADGSRASLSADIRLRSSLYQTGFQILAWRPD